MAIRYSYQQKHFYAIREDQYLDRVVRERNLIVHLNNAKWVKLLDALVAHHSLIKECQVKLIWEEKYTGRVLLIDEYTQHQFSYYDGAIESMITGQPSGWYAYREIEWLSFPRHITGQPSEQDLDGIQTALACIGQLSLVLTSNTLRLDAYRGAAS